LSTYRIELTAIFFVIFFGMVQEIPAEDHAIHQVYFMPFTNLESKTVYPELQSYLTEKGRAELYSKPFMTELDQATFHKMMQKSFSDTTDYSNMQLDPRRYVLVNEYEVYNGELHLMGELLSLRTLASLGYLESTGNPADPEQAIRNYITEVHNKFFTTPGDQSAEKPPVKDKTPPAPALVKEEVPVKVPPEKSEEQPRLSAFNKTVQSLTVLLTSDTLYNIQYEEPAYQALTGSADTYEAWMTVALTPNPDLLAFLRTNKYVKAEDRYSVLTLPASLESGPPDFRSLLKQGYGNLAVNVDFFAPDNSKIEPVGKVQYLEQKEDYNTIAGQQFFPVQMLQTNRTVKLYFLTEPREINVVVPVYLPNTLRIDRIEVGLEP